MFEIIKRNNFWDKQPIKSGYLRSFYIDQLSEHLETSLVKVLLGQRRVGKSYILRMLINHLIDGLNINPINILYLNMDIQELNIIDNASRLMEAINEYRNNLKPKGKVYIFIDEVHEIEGWEKTINSLSQDYLNEYNIFITGSNANLLSSELSTYIAGRFVTFEIFPFSYTEFLGINQQEQGKISFLEYLKVGGIPETYDLKNSEMKRNYIANLKDSIVLRDVIQRNNIRDVSLLDKLIDFMIDSVGSLFSINSVVKTFTNEGYKTNSETIGNYISYLKTAYFLHESPRYDIKGKKILSGVRKYYLNDLSFKYFPASSFDFGIGKYLENLVYIHLKREDYKIYTGQIAGKEIDFIAEKDGIRKYIQVTYLLSDENIVEREFGNLENIPNSYEKMVISMDDISFGNRNGIQHRNVWDVLAES